MKVPRFGIKTRVVLSSAIAVGLLLVWDHTFDPKGWVPSLGANIITMVMTVVVIDSLLRRREQRHAAAILRAAILKIDAVLAHTAQGYQAERTLAQGWFAPQVVDWKIALESLRMNLQYSSADLPHPTRQLVRDLEDLTRYFAEMTWEQFWDECGTASKRLNEAWLLLCKIQQELYPHDAQLEGYLAQTERDDLIKLRARFAKDW